MTQELGRVMTQRPLGAGGVGEDDPAVVVEVEVPT